MKKYLILGAGGLLGINLSLQLTETADVVGCDIRSLKGTPFRFIKSDLSQPGEVGRLIEVEKPDVVINCAAVANVDACEKDPEMAFQLNADLPGEMAQATSKSGIKLIHISTDAVFNGRRGNYTENDEPNPINIYGRTKVAGEQAVAAGNPDTLIARVNFFGWSLEGERSLAEWIFNNLSAGKQIRGFTDVMFCPLHVQALGELLQQMVERGLSGLYHVVSSECMSKYDFACRLAGIFGFDPGLIQPSSWKSAGLAAPRSTNLSLSVEKLTLALGRQPPAVVEGLKAFYRQYQQDYPHQIRIYFA